ncbi:unknown [Clostridium sp. CAG:793]|nr:unknown [Clostridium sp. CAG:793]
MNMYQKRKIRAEKKNNNQEEKIIKNGINWYPRTYG